MANPYTGEIRMFAGSFAPAGWAFCDGQLLAIAEYDQLFQLIGTTYGGDGQDNFALPDLRGRIALHQGQSPGTTSRVFAEAAGVEQVTLATQHLPVHTHAFLASTDLAGQSSPSGNLVAQLSTAGSFIYTSAAPSIALAGNSIQTVGGSQPHNNFQPYLCLSFIISLFGLYPSPT